MSELEPGEEDPTAIYIAVGRAIHCWEGLEEALARLYLALSGLPESMENLATYGKENRRFSNRMIAIRAAADGCYFVRRCHQDLEGEFSALYAEILDMGIARHRIAHGHISMVAGFKLPDPLPPKGTAFEMTAQVLYRWGAPFYATQSLRTDPIGLNASQIDAWTDKFMSAHNRVQSLTEKISGHS